MKITHSGKFRFPAVAAMMLATMLAYAAPVTAEEEAAPQQVSEEFQKEAAGAYDTLIDNANARFAKAQEEKTTGVELELADEFEAFATKYEGTEEAVIAWIQGAMLARMANDFDRAQRYLETADRLTDNPSHQAEIQRELMTMKIRPGMPAPNFQVSTVDGDTLRPDDLRGTVFLLDFWATWCAPCIAELPNVKKVYEEYHAKGFEIVSISLDEDREYFEQFIKNQGMNWIHVYNADQAEGQDLAERYGIVSIPRMILVDENGSIIEAGLRGHDLNKAVEKAVGGES